MWLLIFLFAVQRLSLDLKACAFLIYGATYRLLGGPVDLSGNVLFRSEDVSSE
jgi:hypothetical protein